MDDVIVQGATIQRVMNSQDLASVRQSVPANYYKGARPTWHQSIRHAAVFGMLDGLKGRVLDYGCGYGDQVFALSKKGYDVCGVDLDPARVAFAQQEYSPLEFKSCTPADAPYADASFDIVTSIVVLNFIPDAKSHLRSIGRLLKPGGHLLLAWKNLDVVRNAVRRVLGRGPVPSKIWMRSKNEVHALLKEGNFLIDKESYFYEPPLECWKNYGDYVVGTVEQLLRIARVSGTAGYLLVLARYQGT